MKTLTREQLNELIKNKKENIPRYIWTNGRRYIWMGGDFIVDGDKMKGDETLIIKN